jgi:hypothetical protein
LGLNAVVIRRGVVIDRKRIRSDRRRAKVLNQVSKAVMATTQLALAFTLAIGVAAPAVGQEPDLPQDASVRLQRTSCFGPCPMYTVTIDARGKVTYEGEGGVRVIGRRTARIDQSTVAELLAKAESIHFFRMRDAYRAIRYPDGTMMSGIDGPTAFVTVTVNGQTKKVEDYLGAPDSLVAFEREIDGAAGTRRWVFLDEDALEELARSGWLASSDEGATLLQQAIQRDDLAIARRLIELGSDPDGPLVDRFPPLMSAVSGAMVDLLVKAGANPNERPLHRGAGRTPLMSTSYKDASVAKALLKAGARVEDMDDERTALYYAACAANWRVVAVLLGAGASPKGSTEMSAADCARQQRQMEADGHGTVRGRGAPSVEDFDRVLALLESADKSIKR